MLQIQFGVLMCGAVVWCGVVCVSVGLGLGGGDGDGGGRKH